MTHASDVFPLAPQDGRPAGSAGRALFKSQSQWLAEAEAEAAAEAAARAEARAARRAGAAGFEPAPELARPAATNSACGSASLAPLPQTGGVGGGPVPDPLQRGDAPELLEPDPDLENNEHLTNRTPPPRKPGKPRHDEWTRQKMALFLRELAASQSVAQAARSVGMSRQSAYRLRARLVGTPFAFGWEVALEAGLAQLAHAMLDRAVNGVEVKHYHGGELVGTSRRYDERLSIWLMSNPWKVGRQQIAREYSAEGFDRLLERIETGPLDWEGLEAPEEMADEELEGEASADADRCAGPPDQLPGLLPPARSAHDAGERQAAFMLTRSWYGGGAGDEGREARRWRGR